MRAPSLIASVAVAGAAVALGALALVLSPGGLAEAAPADPNLRRILAPLPASRLSDYGLFTDASATRPSPGLIAYDLAVPLFSDYALKERYLYVPAGTKSVLEPDGSISFPTGTVLVKTFSLPADLRRPGESFRRIETRLLIRKTQGWVASTYLWDPDGHDAALSEVGAQIPHTFVDQSGASRSFTYAVPNRNQCKACHSLDGKLIPLGARARNLDHPLPTGEGEAENQLARWVRLGVLDRAPIRPPERPTLERRARAYLDVNCAHCHNPRGPANNSGLDLSFEQTEPEHLGFGKRPVAAGRGSADLLFDIDPGHPERSILLHRMASTDPAVMMPELGRALVHDEGVALIRDWISSLGPPPPTSEVQTGVKK